MEKQTKPTPVLYMTLGLPGAGKSFFARQYAAAAGIPLLDSDRLRYELFEEPSYNQEEDRIVVSLMDYIAAQFLSAGLSVIYDGMNETRARRHSLRELGRKYHAKPLVVWVQTDKVTAQDRATSRDRRNPNDRFARELTNQEFEKVAAKVKLPQHEDYLVISGKHVFKNQMNVVLRKVSDLSAIPKNVSLGGRVDLTRRQPRPRK